MIYAILEDGKKLSICITKNGIRINGVDIELTGVQYSSLKYSSFWIDVLKRILEKILGIYVVNVYIEGGYIYCID